MWQWSGGGVAVVWQGCGSGLDRVWQWCGSSVAGVWQGCGSGLDRLSCLILSALIQSHQSDLIYNPI